LCNQGIYGPALQIKSQAKNSAFTAAVNQAVKSELHKLEQNRGAKSTVGAGDIVKTGNCFDCGQSGHHRGDPSCPKAKPKGRTAGHGLDEATAKHINLLGRKKLKEYGDISKVPDGLELIEDGKVVARFCSKCRFFSKGLTIHSGSSHGGQGAGAPTPTPPIQANLSSANSILTPTVETAPSPNVPPITAHLGRHVHYGGMMASACTSAADARANTSLTPSWSHHHHLQTNYDFGLNHEVFHDTVLGQDSDDTLESSFGDLLGVLGKDFGR
jgi:hypothetical protein